MTNEVLQKTASDEQNVSSSNGLEPKLRFKDFKANWQTSNLSDYAFFLQGLTYHPEDINHKGTLVLRSSNIQNSLLDFEDSIYVRTEIVPNKIRTQKNDVLMCVRNGSKALVGKTALITSPYCGLAWGAFMTILRPKHNNTLLFFYLNSPHFRKQIYADLDTATVKQITMQTLNSIKINIPSLPEQQKIADFLSLIDQRIEKQRQLVESLKKYKRGLFLKLYNDSDKSIISFKNIYEMASEGGTPSTSDSENYENGKIPFIKIDDLNQHYLNFAKYFITEKGLKKSSAWIVPENSIIYSNGATIGACSINKIPVTTKQGILGIVPKSNFSVEFLYFFFTSSIFKQKIRAITTKGTMDCAYLKDINGIKISIPDFIAQQKIAKIMVDFENLIERTELSFIYLQNIKKALLQQMFI